MTAPAAPTPTAATPTAPSGTGQAATPAQQGAAQPGSGEPQGGQGQATGQGQQGDTPGAAAQTGTPTGTAPTDGSGTPAAPAAPAAPVVPERYELRLPEKSPLDQSDLDTVATLAKANGWTNEQAQGALDEMSTSLTAQAATFRAELDADPEVGGAQLEQAQMFAQRALDRFLPAGEAHGQRLRSAMNKSGYGNFLPLVTLLARIGKAMSEDRPGPGVGGRATPPARSQADRLFGDAQGIKP